MASPTGSSAGLGRFTTNIEDFPSIVATEILSYLDWNEKLNTIKAISSWKPHLHTPSAWPLVKYGKETEENVYFVKEKRANFLISLKIYGKYMRKIEMAFGYSISRTGLHILHAIAEHCVSLKYFRLTPRESMEIRTPVDMSLKKSDITAICSVLHACKQLKQVGIISPYIVWSDPTTAGTNILLELCNADLVNKVTELHLVSTSLIDHDDYLVILQRFTRLKKLTVRREKINDAIFVKLVENGLQEICLYQDEELALVDSRQLGEKLWNQILKLNPNFKVDLILQYILVIKDSFVPNMPLRSIVLDDLVNIVTKGVIDHLVSHYKDKLEAFTYTNLYLENFESGDSRLPGALVTMATKCKQMHTIRYGFPLSSTTILLLANTKKLRELVIPAVEVSYEFDWSVQEGWSPDFVQWLKHNCRSEKLLEQAISEILGFRWKLQYENLSLEKSMGLNLNL